VNVSLSFVGLPIRPKYAPFELAATWDDCGAGAAMAAANQTRGLVSHMYSWETATTTNVLPRAKRRIKYVNCMMTCTSEFVITDSSVERMSTKKCHNPPASEWWMWLSDLRLRNPKSGHGAIYREGSRVRRVIYINIAPRATQGHVNSRALSTNPGKMKKMESGICHVDRSTHNWPNGHVQ